MAMHYRDVRTTQWAGRGSLPVVSWTDVTGRVEKIKRFRRAGLFTIASRQLPDRSRIASTEAVQRQSPAERVVGGEQRPRSHPRVFERLGRERVWQSCHRPATELAPQIGVTRFSQDRS